MVTGEYRTEQDAFKDTPLCMRTMCPMPEGVVFFSRTFWSLVPPVFLWNNPNTALLYITKVYIEAQKRVWKSVARGRRICYSIVGPINFTIQTSSLSTKKRMTVNVKFVVDAKEKGWYVPALQLIHYSSDGQKFFNDTLLTL